MGENEVDRSDSSLSQLERAVPVRFACHPEELISLTGVSSCQEEWKKYSTYKLEVNPDQGDKATQIALCSGARPHMRAFHMSWFAFFMAFFSWFSIAPLLPEIKTSLQLTQQDIWTSNILSVCGTVFIRFLLGPLVDQYGPRRPFSWVLIAASIPTACTGFVDTKQGLYVLRSCISVAGGSFVCCQAWTNCMFVKDIIGTANAIVAGWGNLGGGATHLVVGSALFPLFKLIYGGNANKAWRTVCIVPAFMSFCTGLFILPFSDDTPKGNCKDLQKHGTIPRVSTYSSFRSGAQSFNTWTLFLQYGCSFGVELTMFNAAALYFHEKFGLSTEKSAAVASIFGWLNLFSRALGGYISDKANLRWGMRGRIWVQFINLAMEGIMILIFGELENLSSAIFIMVLFSLFVQMCNGSCFAIVPYVEPLSTGSVSGIVSAGGSMGAVFFGLIFRQMAYRDAFFSVGLTVLIASFTAMIIRIKGQKSAFHFLDI